MTTKPIIVGVDGSPASLDALKWAHGQSRLSGAPIRAVVAWTIPASYGVAFGGDDAIDWRSNARNTLNEAVIEALGDSAADVEQVVEQGHPAHVLIEDSAQGDLLVVGSRGHGGFAGLLLGSVSHQVVAHSACPVVVTRHESDHKHRD